jgi:hypothetical protein
MLQLFPPRSRVVAVISPSPQRGPKPRPIAQRRRNRLMLNLTDAELAQLERVAGATPVAAFARALVLRALSRQAGKGTGR